MRSERIFSRWSLRAAVSIVSALLVLCLAGLAHGVLYDDCDGDGLPDECP